MRRALPVLALALALAFGYSSGPPDRKTGAPGEGVCADCHQFTGSGDSTSLSGFPGGSYVPDSSYRLELTIRHGSQRRWGFELTALTAGGDSAGRLFVIDTPNTQFSTAAGRQYLKQTLAGTFAGAAAASWGIGWRAPPAGTGPVTFHWCGNACNNNGSTSGDYSLAASLAIGEGTGVAEQRPPQRYGWYYLNPARNRVIIRYRGTGPEPVRVYSATGTLVRTLRPRADGDLLLAVWDGTDRTGRPVPEASYFVRLGEEVSEVVKVQLVR
ncbi:MAG: choice-of-anchor V domain-containing protein [bacterium]